jgi:hypothetical protein
MSVNSSLILRLSHLSMRLSTHHLHQPSFPDSPILSASLLLALLRCYPLVIYVIDQLVLLSSAASVLRSVDLSSCRHSLPSRRLAISLASARLLPLGIPISTIILVRRFVAPLLLVLDSSMNQGPLRSSACIPVRQSSSLGDSSPLLLVLDSPMNQEPRSPQLRLHPC